MVQQQRIGDRNIQTLLERWPWLSASAGAALVLASGLYVVKTKTFAPPVPVESTPLSTPLVTTITALGRLEPSGDVVSLSAPSAGERTRVEQLLVKQGDTVTAGQIIAILDNQLVFQAAAVEAERQVAIAKAELARVKAGAQSGDIDAQQAEVERLRLEREDLVAAQEATIRRLKASRSGDIATQEATVERIKAELSNAKADAQRYRDLYKDGAITASEQERFLLAEETAVKRLQEAEASLERTKSARTAEIEEAEATLRRIKSGQAKQILSASATLDRIKEVRPEDITAAEAQVKAAEANVAVVNANLHQTSVRASQNGVILKVNTRAGERLNPLGIVDIGQTQTMTAIAEIYESDIGKVRLGQSATVTSDVIEDELQGKVVDIGLQIQPQRVADTNPAANVDNRIIEVKVELDKASSEKVNRLTNLQVEVTIHQGEEDA